MIKQRLTIIALIAGTLGLGQTAFALDQSLVGVWTGVLNTPKGQVTATWLINPRGVYKARFSGALQIPDDEGELVADGGRWRRHGLQNTESGTYSVPGPSRFITVGSKGQTEWRKVSELSAAAWNQPSSNTLASNNHNNSAFSSFSKFNANNTSNTNGNSYGPNSSQGYGNNYGSNSSTSYGTSYGANSSNGYGNSGANSYSHSASNPSSAGQVVPGAYDPRWNPANFDKQTTPQNNGYYKAPPVKAYNPWAPENMNPRAFYSKGTDAPMPADLQRLLVNDFPLPANGDEVQQFGLPALGRAAAGGMRKREFRMIQ